MSSSPRGMDALVFLNLSEGFMGIRNYLVEGVSCSGKTSVATELQRQGYHAIHGDRELAYKGDPRTGLPLLEKLAEEMDLDFSFPHRHNLWRVEKLRALAADQSRPATFFCGGARNFPAFIDLFDKVFILNLDKATLEKRLLCRPADEFGGKPEERGFILALHESRQDVPTDGIVINSARPVRTIVAELLSYLTSEKL